MGYASPMGEAKGALGHFTDDVLSRKTREVSWVYLLNVYFSHPDQQESWRMLAVWAKKHGIRWSWEYRRHARGKDDEIWVLFTPPPPQKRS